jgi:LmbE family N-acetylglucosaminyl deacetylase
MRLGWFFSVSVALLPLGDAGAATAPAAEPAKPAKMLLAVLAHPDDEMVCAGTLARAAASGWEIRVIYATSGDAGEDVSGRKLKGAALGREREREGACALAALGLKGSPAFLGFGDGTLAQAQQRLTERLAKELPALKPDVILTFGPDGFTGHADHIAVGKATDEVARKGMPYAAVYHAALGRQLEGFARAAGAAVPQGVKLPENLLTVDVKAFQQQRLASLDCHKTQWTAEVQARLRDFRRDYPFEEFVWAGGGQGAPGKWLGP